jgi:two-component system, NtrC family, response regulator GlrR
MEEITIFLIDPSAASEPGNSVRQILASSKERRFRILEKPTRSIGTAPSASDLTRLLSRLNPDVILLILSPHLLEQAKAMIRQAVREQVGAPILVISGAPDSHEIIELLGLGAADFVTAPLRAADLLPRISRCLKAKSPEESFTQQLKEELGLKELIGQNLVFRTEMKKIPTVAKCDVTVLISGETGTGKELCARAIHYLSPRSGYPFVAVNCGALPVELVENELFGHARGAFTGANAPQEGLIHEADQGSLFLDEIDCLPVIAQAKLLRFLQGKEYKQLGSKHIEHANVRIIAATNIDLERAVCEGRFRQDLLYRLNIIPLILPALRERRDDIPLLARHFLEMYSLEFNKDVSDLSSDAIQMLAVYPWPGNVRELENVVERAVILCDGSVLRPADIVFHAWPRGESEDKSDDNSQVDSLRNAKASAVRQFEKEYIERVLLSQNGNITKAATAAGKNRRAFWELVRKYKIDVQGFKSGLGKAG